MEGGQCCSVDNMIVIVCDLTDDKLCIHQMVYIVHFVAGVQLITGGHICLLPRPECFACMIS